MPGVGTWREEFRRGPTPMVSHWKRLLAALWLSERMKSGMGRSSLVGSNMVGTGERGK